MAHFALGLEEKRWQTLFKLKHSDKGAAFLVFIVQAVLEKYKIVCKIRHLRFCLIQPFEKAANFGPHKLNIMQVESLLATVLRSHFLAPTKPRNSAKVRVDTCLTHVYQPKST